LTRNKSIKFNDNFKIFFNEYLVAEVKLIEVLIQLHFKYHFDKISVFNGRLSQTRPAIEFAIKNKIPYSCLELIAPSMDGIFFPMNFEQSLPHDIAAYDRKVNEYWNFSNLPIIEREKIACDFYEKRKKGIRAGDRVYTENQKIGLLPLQWDETVSNISIFNSSDDEYSSIGGEWDKGNLFSSQIEGIKKIVEHYLEDKNKHFYLRIHPNLSSVKYKYHTDLYKLNYPNLTILKSDSPVSTYSLIDNSKIIIVFGSSVGIEAAYWKKPVVLLTKSMYVYSGCVYYPTNLDSLWALLKTENLPTLFNESVLKYGFFNNYEPKNTKSLLNYDYVNIRLFNHEYQSSSFLKVLNSQKLFIIFRKIYFVFFSIITFGKIKYKTIPSDES